MVMGIKILTVENEHRNHIKANTGAFCLTGGA